MVKAQSEVIQNEYFDFSAAPNNFGITFLWGEQKCHFPWISYEAFFLRSTGLFEMYFGKYMVRGEMTDDSTYPMNDLIKAIEQRFIYAIWDLPEKGFRIRVYELSRDEDGNTIETPI